MTQSKMKKIGITGGIGSGKSTVAAIYSQISGFKVIDADKLSREATDDSAIKKEIASAFGEKYFDGNYALKRKELAALIFSDEKARKKLNSIIHPYVRRRFNEICRAEEKEGASAIIYDCPLLIEENLIKDVDVVVLVYADEKTRIKNVILRDGVSETNAAARISAQMNMESKIAYSDIVIYNNSDLQALKNAIINTAEKISSYESR